MINSLAAKGNISHHDCSDSFIFEMQGSTELCIKNIPGTDITVQFLPSILVSYCQNGQHAVRLSDSRSIWRVWLMQNGVVFAHTRYQLRYSHLTLRKVLFIIDITPKTKRGWQNPHVVFRTNSIDNFLMEAIDPHLDDFLPSLQDLLAINDIWAS